MLLQLPDEIRNEIYSLLVVGHMISIMPGRQRARLSLHLDMKTLRSLSHQFRDEVTPWIYSRNLVRVIYYSLPTIVQQIGRRRAKFIRTTVLPISGGGFFSEAADSEKWKTKLSEVFAKLQNEGSFQQSRSLAKTFSSH